MKTLPREWKLAEAKNKFSEVVTKAVQEGPQFVQRLGDEVVVISREEYNRLTRAKPSLIEHIMAGPSMEGVDVSRDKSTSREIEL